MLKQQMLEHKKNGTLPAAAVEKVEGFWGKKWIKGAGSQINRIKDYTVPIPKLPPMPSSTVKQP
jgi:hypothetical protein